MPEVHFFYDHDFSGLAQAVIDNKKFHGARIDLFEKVKFDLDCNGVRLGNQAAMVVGMGMPPESIKRLILDKPFWLIMRKKGRANPYVILGVNNTEIMTKNSGQ